MSWSKTIHSDFSRHEMHVSEIPVASLPPQLKGTEGYTKFYVVRNWNADGVTFMYLGTGWEKAPREIVAWYAKTGAFWSGYGKTLKEAIEGAQRDGWLYA